MSPLIGRSLRAGLAWGAAAGLAVAVTATAIDWRANPAGLFHGEAGTHWRIVAETAWSWFWPVALTLAPLAAVVKAGLLWRAARRRPPE